jgi:hypothetical protein
VSSDAQKELVCGLQEDHSYAYNPVEVGYFEDLNTSFYSTTESEIMDTADGDTDEEEMESTPLQPDVQQKYIVFEDNLMKLFQFCPECQQPFEDVEKAFSGTLLTIKYTCLQGRANLWQSQPTLNGMSAGNLLLSAAILFSGSTYAKVAHLFEIFNLPILKERTFYAVQSKYLFPVVHQVWKSHQQELHHKLRGQCLAISGDGRCDSPGFSAKYCTYTIMVQDTGEILHFQVVQVTETTSSVAMEKEGSTRCLDDLLQLGFQFSSIATDRHLGIAALCPSAYTHINHQFDVWHVSKGIVKKLTKAAKQRGCQELSPWIQSISNHLWWSCQTCDGDPLLLKEKWMSVLLHCCNKHTWGDSEKFTTCAHPPLHPDRSEGTQ